MNFVTRTWALCALVVVATLATTATAHATARAPIDFEKTYTVEIRPGVKLRPLLSFGYNPLLGRGGEGQYELAHVGTVAGGAALLIELPDGLEAVFEAAIVISTRPGAELDLGAGVFRWSTTRRYAFGITAGTSAGLSRLSFAGNFGPAAKVPTKTVDLVFRVGMRIEVEERGPGAGPATALGFEFK